MSTSPQGSNINELYYEVSGASSSTVPDEILEESVNFTPGQIIAKQSPISVDENFRPSPSLEEIGKELGTLEEMFVQLTPEEENSTSEPTSDALPKPALDEAITLPDLTFEEAGSSHSSQPLAGPEVPMVGNFPKVLKGGVIFGLKKVDPTGEEYYSFCNVPYAKYERFKDPVEQPPFGKSDCGGETTIPREGTLFLNVYTPMLPEEVEAAPLPVIVFIPGETYLKPFTHIEIYSPTYLMHHRQVVVVTVTYRQGIMGFLKLENPALGVPGNAGLKDIIMALLWVQSNIQIFLGDANNVTVWGHGMGAACVHHLILNHEMRAKNFIKNVILQSGSACHSWGNGQLGALEYVRRLGIKTEDPSRFLKQLQELPLGDILGPEREFQREFREHEKLLMAPTIDDHNDENFLEGFVKKLENSYPRKPLIIPVMMGFNSHEGLLAKMVNADLQHYFSSWLIERVDATHDVGDREDWLMRKYASSAFSQGNFKEGPPCLYIIITYLVFAKSMKKAAKALVDSGYAKVYFYKFSYDTSLNIMKMMGNIGESGTCHGDDLGYIFKTPLNPASTSQNSTEAKAIQFMVNIWQNFAKTGAPTTVASILQWPPLKKNQKTYMHIGRLPKILDNFDDGGIIMYIEVLDI